MKWGARVIACLSPPGLGCLWILAQSVLEKAAAKVVDTCWFKRKITPLVNRLPYVKGLPARIAEGIREKLVPLLPASLQDMFAKIETDEVHVGEGDLGCDTNDDPERDALTAERRAMFDLIEAVGEERFDALVDALMAAGVRFDKRLSVTEIHQAKKIIVGSRVTAEQLRHYAKWYAPFADKRTRGPLGDFVNGLARTDPQSVEPFADPDVGGGEGESEGGVRAPRSRVCRPPEARRRATTRTTRCSTSARSTGSSRRAPRSRSTSPWRSRGRRSCCARSRWSSSPASDAPTAA